MAEDRERSEFLKAFGRAMAFMLPDMERGAIFNCTQEGKAVTAFSRGLGDTVDNMDIEVGDEDRVCAAFLLPASGATVSDVERLLSFTHYPLRDDWNKWYNYRTERRQRYRCHCTSVRLYAPSAVLHILAKMQRAALPEVHPLLVPYLDMKDSGEFGIAQLSYGDYMSSWIQMERIFAEDINLTAMLRLALIPRRSIFLISAKPDRKTYSDVCESAFKGFSYALVAEGPENDFDARFERECMRIRESADVFVDAGDTGYPLASSRTIPNRFGNIICGDTVRLQDAKRIKTSAGINSSGISTGLLFHCFSDEACGTFMRTLDIADIPEEPYRGLKSASWSWGERIGCSVHALKCFATKFRDAKPMLNELYRATL